MPIETKPWTQITNDQFLDEYLSNFVLGHMKLVNLNKAHPKYFKPHHGEFKSSQDEKTTQLHIVFNASA